MSTRKTIDVDLAPSDALALVEASFVADRIWTIKRDERRLLAYPTDPGRPLLDPLPDSYSISSAITETLAVLIEATTLEGGGARVSVRITRIPKRVLGLIGTVALDLVTIFYSFAFASVSHAAFMFKHRKNRENAKLRMIRLAVEPLLRHERGADHGPFRRR